MTYHIAGHNVVCDEIKTKRIRKRVRELESENVRERECKRKRK